MAKLDKEFQFYQKNKDALLPEYEGKFVVIVGEKVVGAYDDRIEAINKTREKYELGTFLVHFVQKEEKIPFFHSRVFFKNARQN